VEDREKLLNSARASIDQKEMVVAEYMAKRDPYANLGIALAIADMCAEPVRKMQAGENLTADEAVLMFAWVGCSRIGLIVADIKESEE